MTMVPVLEGFPSLSPTFPEDVQFARFIRRVGPEAVKANAHRFYDWVRSEIGLVPDSVAREDAFTFAADCLGIEYDALYYAWLNGVRL